MQVIKVTTRRKCHHRDRAQSHQIERATLGVIRQTGLHWGSSDRQGYSPHWGSSDRQGNTAGHHIYRATAHTGGHKIDRESSDRQGYCHQIDRATANTGATVHTGGHLIDRATAHTGGHQIDRATAHTGGHQRDNKLLYNLQVLHMNYNLSTNSS